MGLFWNNAFCSIFLHCSWHQYVLEMGKYEASLSASFNFWVAIWLCSIKVFPSFFFNFFPPFSLLPSKKNPQLGCALTWFTWKILYWEVWKVYLPTHFVMYGFVPLSQKYISLLMYYNTNLSCFSRQVSKCSYVACC